MTKERVRQLTDIMARILHYQDSGEPNWAAMDYTATKREYDELPKPIIYRYMNDAKFHAQVQRAVALLLELDRNAAEPDDINLPGALKWLRDVADAKPNTGVRPDGVLQRYAGLLLRYLPPARTT